VATKIFIKMISRPAHQEGKTGKILNRLFQQSFSVAKKVRTETAIGANAVSVAYAAVNLAKQIFADLSEQRVLMIGAGETIKLAAQHLQGQGVTQFTIANRTLERGVELAKLLDGRAIELTELSEELINAEIIISSTASTLPIVGKGMIESTLKKRKNKRMFFVDLAVPRDIEPEVAKLRNVYLYTVDDLREVVSENIDSRKRAAEHAEHIEKSLKRIQAGDAAEEVLKQFAHAISHKFLHQPTTEINNSSDEQILTAARTLFGLKPANSEQSAQFDPTAEISADSLDNSDKKH